MHTIIFKCFIYGRNLSFAVSNLLFLFHTQYKKLNHYRYFLNYLFPLTFISLFDGSMENPYFGLMFYFMLSIFFVNKNNIMSKT